MDVGNGYTTLLKHKTICIVYDMCISNKSIKQVWRCLWLFLQRREREEMRGWSLTYIISILFFY